MYVTGFIQNSSTNTFAVQFGGTALNGVGSSASADVFVAKYLDAGTSAAYQWGTAGGGTSTDIGYGIAVSGSRVEVGGGVGGGVARFGPYGPLPANTAARASLDPATGAWQDASSPQGAGASTVRATAVNAAGEVFVTGNFSGQVGFGATVLTSAGDQDVFVAKWNPAAAAWAWATAGGGTGADQANGLAVSGTGVFVTGSITNTSANASAVQFGGTPLNGVSAGATQDVFVAKYTDAGSSAIYNWARAGGGTRSDVGQGIAVSGTGVYVTGFIQNNNTNGFAVQFGGTALNGTSTGLSNDVFVA